MPGIRRHSLFRDAGAGQTSQYQKGMRCRSCRSCWWNAVRTPWRTVGHAMVDLLHGADVTYCLPSSSRIPHGHTGISLVCRFGISFRAGHPFGVFILFRLEGVHAFSIRSVTAAIN